MSSNNTIHIPICRLGCTKAFFSNIEEEFVVQQFAQLVLRNLQIAFQSTDWHASSVCGYSNINYLSSTVVQK